MFLRLSQLDVVKANYWLSDAKPTSHINIHHASNLGF